MDELRKCWKVPYIVYFCNLFYQTLDLIDLRIDEFEEAIVDDSGNERNIVIMHLLQKLLKPFINRNIDLTNFESSLLSVLKKYGEENLFLDGKETNHWNDLTMNRKIDIICLICDLRLHLSDIETKFNELEPNSLRIEPIGVDSNGNKFWYFGDLRLYEEKEIQKAEPVKQVEKSKSKNKKSRKSNKRKSKAKNEEADESAIEKEEEREDISNWECVCMTLDDWNNLAAKYKRSRKKADQEFYQNLQENYVNEMPALFHKAERERQQRLLSLAPKRTSQRLESKRQVYVQVIDTVIEQKKYSDNDTNTSSTSVSNDVVDKLRKEELSKQREERLKLREMRKDMVINENTNDDELTQNSTFSEISITKSSDFNNRNYILMNKVVNKLLSGKYSWPFRKPVTEDDAPDYKTIVQHPMDLSIIQLKVNNKLYKSRHSFVNDLQLIVSNCCLYNGVDTFYGKLALKFKQSFEKWLNYAYPHEISDSFEEKNRLLMRLGNRGGSINDENDDSMINGDSDTMQNTDAGDINVDSDSINVNDATLNEPEYITKRTSSGRLVKMKVNMDYDYTSDQDEKGKKRKSRYYEDEEFKMDASGKLRRPKNDGSDVESDFDDKSSPLANGDNVLIKKKRAKKLKIRDYNSTNSVSEGEHEDDDDDDDVDSENDADYYSNGKDSENEEDDDDGDSDQNYGTPSSKRKLKSKLKNALKGGKRRLKKILSEKSGLVTIDSKYLAANGITINNDNTTTSNPQQKLTFEQYVKILTGSNKTQKPPSSSSSSANETTTKPTSSTTTTIANTPKLIKNIPISNLTKQLKVPIINPAITAVLEANRLKQQQQQQASVSPDVKPADTFDSSPPNIPNLEMLNKSIKLIALPQSSQTTTITATPTTINNKKLIVINNHPTTTSLSTPTTATTTPIQSNPNKTSTTNVIKIVNLSELHTTQQNSQTPAKIITQQNVKTPTPSQQSSSTIVSNGITNTNIGNLLRNTQNKQIILINNNQIVNKSTPTTTIISKITPTHVTGTPKITTITSNSATTTTPVRAPTTFKQIIINANNQSLSPTPLIKPITQITTTPTTPTITTTIRSNNPTTVSAANPQQDSTSAVLTNLIIK